MIVIINVPTRNKMDGYEFLKKLLVYLFTKNSLFVGIFQRKIFSRKKNILLHVFGALFRIKDTFQTGNNQYSR